MKVKVIEAMYRGLPVVTTNIGAESIELANGVNCMIADGEEEFADAVIILLKDKEKWNIISKASRKLALENYSWESEYRRLDEIMKWFDK
jgi:glycosyltransferase involved in cell wall biosynthesis